MTKALAVVAAIGFGSAAGGAEVRPPCDAVLALLHEGRFDEAAARVEPVRSPESPEPSSAFLGAFVTYWRLLYDDENPALRRALEARLNRAIEEADRAAEARPAAADPLAWAGAARMLLAQLHASNGKPLKAGFEAKKGKRSLEKARGKDPGLVDPLFGLGAYNYYASQVPALVKGIRFLLALPGGDRALGLSQLTRAARDARCFGLEARLLLATVYASDNERDFEAASRQLRRALSRHPDRVAVLHSAALLELSLARPESAIRLLERALDRASHPPAADDSVIAVLRFHLARARIARFRPDRALRELRPLFEGTLRVPDELASKADELARVAARWVSPPRGYPVALEGGPGAEERRALFARVHAALELRDGGRLREAAELLEAEARATPEQPLPGYLAGHAFLEAGEPARAIEWLERAESSPDLPEAWLGPVRLAAGRAADLLGRRELAETYYRSSLDAPAGFTGRDAAWLHLERPYAAEEDAGLLPPAAEEGSGQVPEDSSDVAPGLDVGGDAPVALDRPLSGVVGRQGELETTVEPPQQPAQIAGSAVEILLDVEDVVHPEAVGGFRDELEDAARPLVR